MIAWAVADLPQPLSPTSPSTSPAASANETLRTARTTPRRVKNAALRSSSSRRVRLSAERVGSAALGETATPALLAHGQDVLAHVQGVESECARALARPLRAVVAVLVRLEGLALAV